MLLLVEMCSLLVNGAKLLMLSAHTKNFVKNCKKTTLKTSKYASQFGGKTIGSNLPEPILVFLFFSSKLSSFDDKQKASILQGQLISHYIHYVLEVSWAFQEDRL